MTKSKSADNFILKKHFRRSAFHVLKSLKAKHTPNGNFQ
nr:MAG TPA: hypothetical protein [Caudoviricetes sp.]